MGNIGSFKPLEINGRTSFKTLDEAKQAAGQRTGSEAIVQREDGVFEVHTLESISELDTAAGAHQKSQAFDQDVSFGNAGQAPKPDQQIQALPKAHLSVQLSDGSSVMVPVTALSKDKLIAALNQAPQNLSPELQADFARSAAPIISALRGSAPNSLGPSAPAAPIGRQLSDTRMTAVADSFAAKSKEEMEKEFRFAPEGSNKWKLLKAMELLGKLNQDAGTIQDPEAREVLNMRRGQLEDLIKQLNELPEIQEAYSRIRETAMKDCGISQTELSEQADYILSDAFAASLKGKPEAQQQALIRHELAKIQFFNPEFAQTVAAELGARSVIDSGLEQYRGLSPQNQAKAKQVVEYMIDDLIKNANTTQDKALKPLRELQKLAASLPPAQWEALRRILVNEVFMEGDLEGALKKAAELDGKKILKALEEAEKAGTIKFSDAQKAQIKEIKWQGNVSKILSSAAAIGTGISIGRSIEELQNKGLNLKNGMDLLNKTISMLGASKDIAATGSLLLKTAGSTSGANVASKAAAFFESFRLVKWAGPITSALTTISDGIDTYDRIQKEDRAGAWLKGIGTGAGVVATVAGGVALWTTSASAAALAGPIGLAAVAVVGVTAIAYNCVKESEETGEFRQDLRKLGLSNQAEQLEAAFQQACDKVIRGPKGSTTTKDAQQGFAWAKDKPVAERASLIGSLLDQSTDPYEEKVISLLFKDAVGKNKDANQVDDFDRLISRTDMRRVGRELQPAQLKELIEILKSRTDPAAKEALQQLVIGIAADHEYSLLTHDDGSLAKFIQDMPAAVKQEIAAGLMSGYTSGTGETLLSQVILDLPVDQLAELLGRGGTELIKNLVSELPQAEAGRLMARFAEMDQVLIEAKADFKAQPSPENKAKVDVLEHALSTSLNNFMVAISDETNRTFYSYEDVMEKTLTPAITRHLSPETLSHVCRKLMNTTVWTPDQSSAALVKLLKQTTPAQFQQLMKGSTDTFLRQILAGSTTKAQSKELLEIFLAKAGGTPDRNFQTIALGMMHQPTLIGMDWSYEEVVKEFIKSQPNLDLSAAPALRVVVSERTEATLEGLIQDRGKIAGMSNEDKAIIIKFLMDGWTSDKTETLLHDILLDANQDKSSFKELCAMIDCYQLANELGDAVISGRGDKESLAVFEMLARDADPKDFMAYANRLGTDKNIDVLYHFSAKAENQALLSKLPGPVVKEMCERLMQGYTNGHAEKAITMLLKHASDDAFLDAVKDKKFTVWLTQELQTNDANWVFSVTGDDDQIKTLMQRLGKLAQQVELAGRTPAADRSPADKLRLGQKAEVSAALESFALACAQAGYAEVMHQLATSSDTAASVHLLSPAALKAVTESLMAGWASGKDQSAVMALLEKTTPKQLRELLDKPVGGQALSDKLASKLTTSQLRGLMEKMISDGSVTAGMGFSYLAASLAKEHEGATLRDLIADKPQMVRQINPTVLQNMVVSLSKGWTSSESREAIAGILKHATPEQLELILQSNTSNPKQVSDWVVYTLTDAELSSVLSHFAKGSGAGRGVEAFVASLAHDKPAILSAASRETLDKLSPATLTAAARDCALGYTASTFGGEHTRTLSTLLAVAEDKGDTVLKGMLEGIELKTAGKMLAGDQHRFNQILQKVTKLGNDGQFKSFIENAPNDTLMQAWPSLRDSKIPLTAPEREALFRRCVNAADYEKAMELLKGVKGSGAADSLLGSATGKAMVGYLAEHLGNFGKEHAIEAGKLILGYGSPEQIDASFKQINTRFYFGRGADVVKEILGSISSEAEKKAIYGKMPKSTLEHLVGTMDSGWYKTIGQISGSYGENMDFLKDIAKLVDPAGKRTMVLALANSWWTPPRAEQLMFEIMEMTSFDNHQFFDLINDMSSAELKVVLDNLENETQAGTVTAWIAEAEIRRSGSTGANFEIAAGHIAYHHRNEAIDVMRTVLKDQYKSFDKVKPEHIVMIANKFMDGDTNYNEEECIYQLLKACSWPQFAESMADSGFRDRLKSELSSAQWTAVQQWFWDIPKHVN